MPELHTELLMEEFHTVCRVGELAAGESRMFVVGEKPVGLFNVDGEFLAISNECPHAGASLAHGIVDGATVACRIHHWRFCLKTGEYLDEDRPEYNAETFATRISGDEVQVSLDTRQAS